MSPHLYQNFIIALMSLGRNDQERAQVLGVSTKSIGRYRDGLLPEPIRRMMRYPFLIEALAADAVDISRTTTHGTGECAMIPASARSSTEWDIHH